MKFFRGHHKSFDEFSIGFSVSVRDRYFSIDLGWLYFGVEL